MDDQIPNTQPPTPFEPNQNPGAVPPQIPPRPPQGSMEGISSPRPIQRPTGYGVGQPQSNGRPVYRTPSRPLQPSPRPMQRPMNTPPPSPAYGSGQQPVSQPSQHPAYQSNPIYQQPQQQPIQRPIQQQQPQPLQSAPHPAQIPNQQPQRQDLQRPRQQNAPSFAQSHPIPKPIEDAATKKKPRSVKVGTKLRKHAIKVAVVLVIAVLGFQAFSYYSLHYNSIYKKMAITTYNHKGVSFSFNYPQVMQNNKSIEGQLDNTPLVYTYNITDQQIVMITATYIPIKQPMKTLKLTTAEMLSQLKANAGSYVNYLNNTYPGSYNTVFQNCSDYHSSSPGSFIICNFSGPSGTIQHIVGLDSNYQYGLNLFIPKNVYAAHKQIWDSIEQSFTVL